MNKGVNVQTDQYFRRTNSTNEPVEQVSKQQKLTSGVIGNATLASSFPGGGFICTTYSTGNPPDSEGAVHFT